MPCTPEEYNDYYNELLRSPQTSRDAAIRQTNIHFGYGNSTAAQHPVTDEDLPPHVKPEDPDEPEPKD